MSDEMTGVFWMVKASGGSLMRGNEGHTVKLMHTLPAATGHLATVQTLVLSQHDVVRRQLVSYLSRSPGLAVRGEPFTPEAIVRAHPDVLVLDVSRLGQSGLHEAIDAARIVGARLIALASIREPADEQRVTEIGGLYRLKSAGADGLAEIVKDIAVQPAP
jgi:DNA-binding NarL/FixJ family response regulator